MKRPDTKDEWTIRRPVGNIPALTAPIERAAEPLVLVINAPSGGWVVPVPEGDTVIVGRSKDCDVTIADTSVSRRHLRLFTAERSIEDLGSANGSRYDGVALKPHTRVRVELGRPIGLGDVTVFLHAARAVVAPGRSASAPPIVPSPDHIVRDDALRRVYALLPTIAPSPLSVLILGETGVGKEVYADAVHRASPRIHEPFLKLNCAALPESILEGELFGYEKGAFSGAVTARPGLFEAAHRGTVFLDEVGELSLPTQAKLLRVLESGEVLRLGSRTPTRVDVRFIAATNRDLERAIADGTFRRDLFYRLEGVRVEIPPLRERPEDVIALAEYFLARLAHRMGLKTPGLTGFAKEMLCRYSWPGNVRELRNVVERAFVMNPTVDELDEQHLITHQRAPVTRSLPTVAPPKLEDSPTATNLVESADREDVSSRAMSSTIADLKSSVGALERQAILDALAKTAGNQSAAARMLGIGRHALIARIQAYGIERPRKK